MNTKTACGHCGHEFEAADNLVECPKCNQISEPSRGAKPLTSQNQRQAPQSRTGEALVVAGLVAALFVHIVAGLVIAIIGGALMAFSRPKV